MREASSMLFKTRKSVAFELSNACPAWVQTHLPRLSLLLETPLSTRPASMLSAEARLRLNEVIQAAKANSEVANCHLTAVDYVMCK